jgi:hypothetical protein
MPVLTFAVGAEGLAVDVLMGLSRANTQALRALGQPLPQPVPLRALIDTGADYSAVVDTAVAALGWLPYSCASLFCAKTRV